MKTITAIFTLGALVVTAIFTLGALVVTAIVIVKGIQFDQACEGNLKRAADANTIEIAQRELEIALKYIEDNDLTTGYTSVLWKTPDEDIGFWYNNLKTSYNELENLPDSASSLEKSNMLLKLRETLLDHVSKGGDSVTVPQGISRYPSNGLFGTLLIVFWIGTLITWGVVGSESL